MTAVRRHWLALSVLAGALAASAAVLVHAPGPIRVPLVLAFAVFGPGAAIVPLLGLRDPLGELTLAIGTSLAADVVVASALLYAHAWAPRAGMAILIAVALLGVAAQLVRTGRHP